MMEIQGDLFAAKAARDEALGQIVRRGQAWVEQALGQVLNLSHGWEGTGEDVRMIVEPVIGPPHHHNAWGAVMNVAVRRGILKDTGRIAHMKGPKSHARRTPVYRRT